EEPLGGGDDAVRVVERALLGRVEELVVRRGVPYEERQAARHLVAAETPPSRRLRIRLAELDPVEEVGRLQEPGDDRPQALPSVGLRELGRDAEPSIELGGGDWPTERAAPERLDEPRDARVTRSRRLAAHERRAPPRIREDRLRDTIGVLLVELRAELR